MSKQPIPGIIHCNSPIVLFPIIVRYAECEQIINNLEMTTNMDRLTRKIRGLNPFVCGKLIYYMYNRILESRFHDLLCMQYIEQIKDIDQLPHDCSYNYIQNWYRNKILTILGGL